MRKIKDIEWEVCDANGNISSWEKVIISVLMDIRDELKQLNAVLQCRRFQQIPQALDAIILNTQKPLKARKKRP